jgi:hypothetical protein
VEGLELWVKALEKKNSHLVVPGLHSGFFACSPQEFTATMCSEINVSGHFLLVQTCFNQVLFEFLKNIVLVKFW